MQIYMYMYIYIYIYIYIYMSRHVIPTKHNVMSANKICFHKRGSSDQDMIVQCIESAAIKHTCLLTPSFP